MDLIIHRGCNQIGGSCVELQSGGRRLLLDIGMPLVNPDRTPFDDHRLRRKSPQELEQEGVLPAVPGLYGRGPCDVVGVVLSHSHADHYGLAQYVRPEVPIYATPGTHSIIQLTREFLSRPMRQANLQTLTADWKPVKIGPFTVRAHPVDHSAPDAAAIEVVADGKRVLYTGDLRAHGRNRKLFDHLAQPWRLPVHALLMEGSTLGRPAPASSDEASVEKQFTDLVRAQRNLVMIFASGQNPDRVVSAWHAARALDRTLIIDLYGAYVLHVLRNTCRDLPQFDTPGVRVKFWHRQQQILEERGHADFVRAVRNSRNGIRTPEIMKKGREVIMLGRSNRIFPLFIKEFPVDGLTMIWSMWQGYRDEDKYVVPFCDKNNLRLHQIHASGHAHAADLHRLVQGVHPRMLIPVHTDYPDDYKQFGAPVHKLNDRELLAL